MIVYILLGILSIIVLLHIQDGYGQEDLRCIEFSDGKFAIVDILYCDGGSETVSWFLNKGYQIDAVTNDGYTCSDCGLVYMTR